MTDFRTETDSLGRRQLPREAVWGVHTARALENFPITGVPLAHFPELVRALAMVKKAAALANCDLGTLAPGLAAAIAGACDEIIAGRHHEHFVVDMIQGGAGTSTNMNANEVIANLALTNLGHAPGDYARLHPNDHVNRSQSTNDVYPTAIRLAVLEACAPLRAEQQRLAEAFAERARAFAPVIKVGRTQLQDAVPMTLGMEFAGFAATVEEDIARLGELAALLREVNLGGTAIGTGVTTPAGYAALAVRHLAAISGEPLVEAFDRIEASSDLGAFVTFSGVLKRIAVKLSKICNDLRLLSSGPRAGLGEIHLPPVQAGSSIMPGKVNPVIPEVVNQVAYQVIGNDLTVTLAAEAGQLQLNAMEPVLIFNVLQSMRVLTRAMAVLTDRCVTGIEADTARCAALIENSLVLATALVPLVGYEAAAAIAKQALATGRTLADVALETGGLTREQLEHALKAEAMLGPDARMSMTTIAGARRAGATLTVDLGAIRANYRLLRSRLDATACAAVVKADAYGLGAAAVAPALAAEGCRTFFVAHLDEALALRSLLPEAEILVLNGLPAGAEPECARHRVTPVLNSLAQVDAWAALGRRLGRAVPAALQVDSGMSRLGLGEAELDKLAASPSG